LYHSFKLFVVGQSTLKSSQEFGSQTSEITGSNFSFSHNLTPNNDLNTMHSTTKALSSMQTITHGDISLIERPHG